VRITHVGAVLLSHDHHADNLDPAGRALLPWAGVSTRGSEAAGGGSDGGEG
jgi:hypothetical protein